MAAVAQLSETASHTGLSVVLNHGPGPRVSRRFIGMRLTAELLMVVPLVFMAIVGVKERTRIDSFTFTAYDASENAQVSAYTDIVRATEREIKVPGAANVERVRALAHRWVQGAASGTLRAPAAVSFNDTVDEGVKQEIFQADQKVAESLNIASAREREAGNARQAIADAMLALDAGEVTRSFDLSSVFQSISTQRISVQALSEALRRTPSPASEDVWRRLQAASLSRSELASVVTTARRLFQIAQIRKGEPLTAVIATGQELPTQALTDPDDRFMQARLKAAESRDRDLDQARFFSHTRGAYRGFDNLQRRINRLTTLCRGSRTSSSDPNS